MDRYWVPMWVVECGVQREGCVSMVTAADHARCMQDALAMARCVIMLCEANAKTDYASYAEAQRVLETWKED